MVCVCCELSPGLVSDGQDNYLIKFISVLLAGMTRTVQINQSVGMEYFEDEPIILEVWSLDVE